MLKPKNLPKPSRGWWVTHRVSSKIQPGRFLIAGYRATRRRRFLQQHLLRNIPRCSSCSRRRRRCRRRVDIRSLKPLHS